MGWHYILDFTCKVLPEYIDFIEKKYLFIFNKPEYFDVESLSESECSCNYNPQVDEDYKCKRCEYCDSSSESVDEEKEKRSKIYKELNKDYKDLINIWNNLDIADIYEYSFENGIFHCQISKKVSKHEGCLRETYLSFLKDIIVPISSEIIRCTIESDDFGCFMYHYTDTELRGKIFKFRDMIKSFEHTYNEDKTEIFETRIVYKRSIKAIQFLDLDREFKNDYR